MHHSCLQNRSQTNGRGLPKERTWHFHSRINTFCGLKRQPHTNTILGRVQSEQAPQTSESTQQPSGRPYSQEDLNDYHHVIDTEEFRSLGYKVVDFIADYFQGLEEGRHPVKPNIKPGFLNGQLPNAPPENPEPWADIFEDFKSKLMPGVLHWQAPSFFGYFPANSSYPGMLADWHDWLQLGCWSCQHGA